MTSCNYNRIPVADCPHASPQVRIDVKNGIAIVRLDQQDSKVLTLLRSIVFSARPWAFAYSRSIVYRAAVGICIFAAVQSTA
jgi:hypothetical protein